MDQDMKETLSRLRLRKKYSCVVVNPSKEQEGMIKKVKNLIAFGEISKETFEKLLEARGQPVDKKKKVNMKIAADEISKGKKYEELNLKPFFRLHPARGGMNTKVHFPKGVLGNHHEDINKLIERML